MDELEDEEEVAEIQEMESFLKGLSPETIQYKLGVRINQMLRKYRDRKSRIEQRAQEVNNTFYILITSLNLFEKKKKNDLFFNF